MSLKYYEDEFKRYGDMGPITLEEMIEAANKAAEYFKTPRVQCKINPRKKRVSHYKPGLNMASPRGGLAKPMNVPTLDIAPTMMTWLTFVHEFGHHLHYARYNEKAVAMATKAGMDTNDTTENNRLVFKVFIAANIKKEHVHGPSHRKYVQEIVTFFVNNGSIKTKPTYMPSDTWKVIAEDFGFAMDVAKANAATLNPWARAAALSDAYADLVMMTETIQKVIGSVTELKTGT
jgi:hypothetical protein